MSESGSLGTRAGSGSRRSILLPQRAPGPARDTRTMTTVRRKQASTVVSPEQGGVSHVTPRTLSIPAVLPLRYRAVVAVVHRELVYHAGARAVKRDMRSHGQREWRERERLACHVASAPVPARGRPCSLCRVAPAAIDDPKRLDPGSVVPRDARVVHAGQRADLAQHLVQDVATASQEVLPEDDALDGVVRAVQTVTNMVHAPKPS
mmetsp:Transcript_13129/g.41917  ORF Transcript_13129/g.41917 Transcript_13129/m.41917 type:complete len:206 (-) Transcript_13129:533-1150(-)